MEKFEKALLYRGFHCNSNGDKTIIVGDRTLKGSWIVGYLQLTKTMAFITPYKVDVTYAESHSTLMSPAVPVVMDTVSMATGVYDDFDLPQLIFQDDIVEYNDGINIFTGKVCFEAGAFGIGCNDTIPIDSSSDNFISFYEMIINQEVVDDCMIVNNVKVIGNIWEENKNA
jgi:hypothetical protein